MPRGSQKAPATAPGKKSKKGSRSKSTPLPDSDEDVAPAEEEHYGMQFDQMSMGSGMEAAPWKRVNIDRAKWKDIGDIMCVEALDGAEAAKYLFTAQQAEEKFGPDPEFRLSHRALAKKAKREAAAALAAQAAAARLREEELGGVVDPRRPKKQKTIAPDAPAEAEKKSGKSKNARVAIQHDGTDGDAEDTPPAAVKKDKKVKGKAAAECEEPRSYPDSVAWGGEQGVALDGRIAAAVADMGFAAPLPIQSAVIPRAIRDRLDIFGCAETGSGKTLAYAVPVMQRALAEAGSAGWDGQPPLSCAFAIIVVPTRELGVQVYNVCRQLASHTRLRCAAIIGGMAMQKQERLLSRHPHVVIATPGRLWEFISSGHSYFASLHALRMVVIDEADRMLTSGHFKELQSFLEVLPATVMQARVEETGGTAQKKKKGKDKKFDETAFLKEFKESAIEFSTEPIVSSDTRVKRQFLIFSATLVHVDYTRLFKSGAKGTIAKGDGIAMTDEESKSSSFERLIAVLNLPSPPLVFDFTSKNLMVERLSQYKAECAQGQKNVTLYKFLLTQPGRVIVFVNHVSSVRELCAMLQLLDVPARPLHAGLQQRQRLKHLDKFSESEAGVLVATDVAARGLDIQDVRAVVHYNVPPSVDAYVHRSGRTARATADGVSLCLIGPDEFRQWQIITRQLNLNVSSLSLPRELNEAARKRERLASKILKITQAHTKEAAAKSWRRNNLEAMEMPADDDDASDSGEVGKEEEFVQRLKRKAKEEEELLQLRQALKKELEVSVAGKIIDVASAWSLSCPSSDAQAPMSSKRASNPNPFSTPSRGPSAAEMPGLLNASSFIGVPEYSRLFKGSSPTAVSGIRARPAAGGVVATSKESMGIAKSRHKSRR